jgi:hypothetical protein
MAMAPVEERVDRSTGQPPDGGRSQRNDGAAGGRIRAGVGALAGPSHRSVQHQQILFILLAFALVVLGAVAVFALNRPTGRQQVARPASR